MNGRFPWKPIIVLVLLVVTALCFESRLRPIFNTYAVNEARNISVQAINGAVINELSNEGVSYEDLVIVERGANGEVQSITTDMVRMNRFKGAVVEEVRKTLGAYGHKDIGVPLGTLLGNELLHGLGPEVPLRLTLSGNVTADFQSTLESAGINQTKHQISLCVSANVFSFLPPGFRTATTVDTTVPVAETIIVGRVPQMFANLQSSETRGILNATK